MMTENYDVVVIGVGGMGSATVYELARRGCNVCGIERHEIAHDKGSSHGESRIIRKAYFEHPDYIPLLNRAYEMWNKLEIESGAELLVNTGLIVAGDKNSDIITNLKSCYQIHHLAHECWNLSETKKHYPQFNFPDNHVVFFDPFGGYLRVENCVREYFKLSAALGAKIYTNEKVISWNSEEKGVIVKTEKREVHSDKLIITSGAWAKDDVKRIGIEFEIWRKPQFWYNTPGIEHFKPNIFPIFYIDLDYGSFYGFPAINEKGIKVAEHLKPNIIDHPETLDREFDPNEEIPILHFLKTTFPNIPFKRTDVKVCMYSNTIDGHFIVDRHPEYFNVVIGAGFSGHGFKFCPVIGKILSDLTLDESYDHQINIFSINRFKKV